MALICIGTAAAQEDSLQRVDPELRPSAVQMIEFTAARPPLSDESVAEIRAGGFDPRPSRDDVSVEILEVPGPSGAPDLGLVVVNARAGDSRPGILHMHGGGYVLGTAEGGIPGLQDLASALDCVVVSVDYRLAPETRYTGSVEDNYAGLSWMHANAERLGVDPARIAVMGESAGGGHAALLAIAARDRGEFDIALQVLIYPMLDDRTGSSREVPAHIGKILWTAAANRYGWGSFLGAAPGSSAVPAAGVPARVEDLSGLAPAFIAVGDIDLFVEEDIEYARRLVRAGVPTELLVVPGAYHAFDVIAPDTDAARRFTAAKLAALRRAFDSGPVQQ